MFGLGYLTYGWMLTSAQAGWNTSNKDRFVALSKAGQMKRLTAVTKRHVFYKGREEKEKKIKCRGRGGICWRI